MGQYPERVVFLQRFQARQAPDVATPGCRRGQLGSGSSGGCNIYVGKGETFVWGYDSKTRQWTGVGQLDKGSRFVMAISRPPGPEFKPGMVFTFKGTIWHADGKIHIRDIQLHQQQNQPSR